MALIVVRQPDGLLGIFDDETDKFVACCCTANGVRRHLEARYGSQGAQSKASAGEDDLFTDSKETRPQAAEAGEGRFHVALEMMLHRWGWEEVLRCLVHMGGDRARAVAIEAGWNLRAGEP